MNQLPMRRSMITGVLPREIRLLIMIMVAFNIRLSEAAIQAFSSLPNTGCTCAGDTLTYGCTAVGPGNTLWEGSVFDCVAKSIVLRHSLYGTGGASGVCNGGNITARSIDVNNNCYISQLSVRVSSNFNNKTIRCTHDSTMGRETIGSSTLIVLAPYSSPDNVRLTGVQEGLLTFSWDSLGPNCESTNYRIISDCGGCPNSTNLTEINCTELQLSTEARECSVRVHAVLCGGIGNLSSPVAVMLKLPDAPSVQFVPRFSGDTRQLTALLAAISQTDTYAIGDGIPGSVVAYVMKIMSNSEVLLNSSLALMMCDEITCEEFVSVLFQCVSLTDISATLSAANRLGVGPASNPARIDCTNNFVEVKYDESASTITCTFLDLPESTVSVRSCEIRYGGCSSDLAELSRGSTTTTNEVVLNVLLTESDQEYCYLVTASNGLDMVMVEGRISTAGGLPVVAITIATILFIMVVVAIIIAATFVLFFKLRKKSDYHSMGVPEEYLGHVPLNTLDTAAHSEDIKSAEKQGIDHRFNLKRINLDDIVFFKLKTSYPIELKTLVEDALKPKKFERGCAFYEFLYKEDISDVQEIVFVNEDGEYFFPNIGKEELRVEKLIGENLMPPKFEGYRVFVQSTGSGRRYIPKESMALYKHFVRIKEHPLIHVDASKFALRRVPNDCTLKEFCQNCKPRANINAVYIELDIIEDVGDILDVMLLDKATDRVFTGTSALHMVKEHYSQSKNIDDRHWRMYVFKEFGEMYQMRKDMYILYEIQFEVQREEWPLLDIKLPVICADGTPFIQERIEKACTLEAFREKYDLDTDVHNVLVESSRFSESDLESAQIFDVIIEDLMNENTFYTCRALWSIIKVYIKEKHRWRVYILREMGPTFMLWVDTWVLYRAKANQFSDTSLKPIISERFHIVTPSRSCTFDEFRKEQPQKCNIFLELGYLQKDKKMIDVILMEKATEKLYSGLYARDLFKKHFSGSQVLDDVRWKVFVFCKFKSSLRLTSTTQVLCQDYGPLAQAFRVLKVDEENDIVRMSEFIKQEVGDYKKGEAFYEFTQEEDLAFYREILHVPKDVLEHEDENQIVSGEAMISETPQTQQETAEKKLLKLKSDTKSFYDIISGTRGRRLGIKSPNIPGKRVFIQCTSQGSRCLSKGMLILYKVECGE